MQHPQTRLPLWHSLLYSTGILLPIGGVSAGVAFGIVAPMQYHMSRSDGWQLGSVMIAASLFLGWSTDDYEAQDSQMSTQRPSQALQRTRRERRGGNRCVPCAGSLSYHR